MRLLRRRASQSAEATTSRRVPLGVTLLAVLAVGLLAVLGPLAASNPGPADGEARLAATSREEAEASAAARRAEADALRNGTTTAAPTTTRVTTTRPTTTTPRPTTTTARPTTTTARPTTTTARPTTTTARPTTTTAAPAVGAPADASTQLARVLVLVNQERAKVGCGALTRESRLDTAAQKHSVYQAETQTMSHTGRDGSRGGDRITAEGYTWSRWGENVAYGFRDADSVMNAWMNSSGHRANILNCSFTQIGLGLADPNRYWTQNFATPR